MTQIPELPRNYDDGLAVVEEEGPGSRDDQRNLRMKMHAVSMRLQKKALAFDPHMRMTRQMQNDRVSKKMKVELKREEAVVGKRN
jgi:hypothetical protein